MPSPTPETIADIALGRRVVYGITVDTAIRSAAEKLSARSLFRLLERTDDTAPDFEASVRGLLPPFIHADTEWAGEVMTPVLDEPATETAGEPLTVYLRLVFRDAECAYWQFPLFPSLSHEGLVSAARKREANMQHLRLDVAWPEAADELVAAWLGENYHLLRIEPSDEITFVNAPSNAV